MEFLIDLYAKLFARKCFYKINKLLYYLSIRGLGILNYKSDSLSGESHFISSLKKQFNNRKITVLDVGANQGDYSLAIKKMFPESIIHSLEPHPKTYIKLKECAEIHKFNAHNVGAGETVTTLKLYDYAGNNESGSEHASIFRNVIEKIHHNVAQSFEINLITIDSFVKDNNITKIDLIKIDTEGNELGVLKGATECLSNKVIDLIHFEFNEMNVISRVFMKDFFDMLSDFKFYRMLSDGLVPITYNPLTCEIFAFQNIVAIRNDVNN